MQVKVFFKKQQAEQNNTTEEPCITSKRIHRRKSENFYMFEGKLQKGESQQFFFTIPRHALFLSVLNTSLLCYQFYTLSKVLKTFAISERNLCTFYDRDNRCLVVLADSRSGDANNSFYAPPHQLDQNAFDRLYCQFVYDNTRTLQWAIFCS